MRAAVVVSSLLVLSGSRDIVVAVAGAHASGSATSSAVAAAAMIGDAGAAPFPVHPNNDNAADTSSTNNQFPSAIYDSPKDQALWLDRLNWLRSDGLVWAAAGMNKLAWDFTLAEEAHAAIRSCTAQPIETPGLHLFIDSANPVRALDASLIEDAIQSWGINELFGVIPELELPKQTTATTTDGGGLGKGLYNHYSQIVWSTTSHVGCAYTMCAQGRLAACKYSPVGNSPGVGWYEHGSSCSKCPATQAPICSAKLCADANTKSGPSSSEQGVFTLEPSDMAVSVYLKHKVRALQLTLDSVVQQQQTKAAQMTTTVSALSDTDVVGTGTLCNDTSVKITQEQMSLLTNVDGGLSPIAVVFGLFLGVSVILIMIVCIMHATKPKKDRQQSQEKDHDDDRVQVI